MIKQRSIRTCFALLALLAAACPRPAQAQATPSATKRPALTLQSVLDQMDKTATTFRSAQASFVWDQYQKVVDEHDLQKGTVYFRRAGKDTQMAADIVEPDRKYVLYSESKVQVYQPRIDQVTAYDTGKNKADFESFLVLGFGGGGHEMLKSFEVNLLGSEKLGEVDTAKLDLTPKSARVRNNVSHIVLWIDTRFGISVQQEFFQPGGDYRLTKYADIELNQKIPDPVFKLKTTGKTKFVSPQG